MPKFSNKYQSSTVFGIEPIASLPVIIQPYVTDGYRKISLEVLDVLEFVEEEEEEDRLVNQSKSIALKKKTVKQIVLFILTLLFELY